MSTEKTSFTSNYGFYRGVVISHLSFGRCKIWIPGVYPKEWQLEENAKINDIYGQPLKGSKYPTANQAAPLSPGGGSGGNGIFSYPAINSSVWCFFENGDENYPIYFAIDMNGRNAELNYSSCVDSTDPSGNGNSYFISLNKSSIKIQEKSIELKTENATVTMDDLGNMSFKNKNGEISISNIGEITIQKDQLNKVTVTERGIAENGKNVSLVASGEMTVYGNEAISLGTPGVDGFAYNIQNIPQVI